MAIGNYALRRGAVSVVFQDPESAEKRLQAGWRRDLAIPNHLGMIARILGLLHANRFTKKYAPQTIYSY